MQHFLDRLPGLHDPVTLRFLLPLAVAFALAGLIRLIFGPRGRSVASASIPLSFLFVQSIVIGPPELPPESITDKIGWLVLAGLVAGVLLDLARPHRSVGWTLSALVPGAVIGWIGLERILAIPDVADASPGGALETLVIIAVLAGFWIVGSAALARLRATDGTSAAVMLLVAAAGLGVVLLRAGAISLGVPALVLASAIAGFLLWNFGRARYPLGDAAVIGGGTTLLAIGASFGFSSSNAVALVVLALLCVVFFAEGNARRVPLPKAIARIAAPLALAGVAAIPALAAIAIAVLALRP